MSFDPFVHDRLVAVRLREANPETSRTIARLVEHRHDHLRASLVFAMIIGTDCPMPEPDARRQLAADQLRVHPCCASTRTVILGSELRQALVRSLVTGFAMLPGRARPTIDGSITELLGALERTLALDPAWLRERLIRHKLVSSREVDEVARDRKIT